MDRLKCVQGLIILGLVTRSVTATFLDRLKCVQGLILGIGVVLVVALVGCGGSSEKSSEKSGASSEKKDSVASKSSSASTKGSEKSSGGEAKASGNVDAKLSAYKPTTGVSGSIKSVGSDTMNNLMALWGEGFKKHYPSVSIEIEGKGSNTAPPALIKGLANFGPMSREMKQAEIDEFKKAFGYEPVGLKAALDVLAVYVHKDNPIKELSLEQVDAIFSKNRKGGFEKDIATWGDLGLTGEWAEKPIGLYGRNSASGTYGFFKEHALFGGDYKDSVKEQPGSSAVVQSVGADKFAIGYSGIGYKTEDVRAVPLIGKGKDKAVEPGLTNIGTYPLWRYLFVYVNYKPNEDLDPLRREFVKYLFSREGQEDVVKDGYIPVSAVVANKALQSVGISGAAR